MSSLLRQGRLRRDRSRPSKPPWTVASAFAEARKYNLDDPGEKGQEIDLVLKRSTDGGVTWSAMQVIERRKVLVVGQPSHGGRSPDRPHLGLLHPLQAWAEHRHGWPGTDDMANLARFSDDDGATWSEPIDQTGGAPDMAATQSRTSVPGPGGAIQARKGR